MNQISYPGCSFRRYLGRTRAQDLLAVHRDGAPSLNTYVLIASPDDQQLSVDIPLPLQRVNLHCLRWSPAPFLFVNLH